MKIPLNLWAKDLEILSRQYMESAKILKYHGPKSVFPIMQLKGHALELSLKACLASVKIKPSNIHDLNKLYTQVQCAGYILTDKQISIIVHLNHIYFKNITSQTRYQSRYPANKYGITRFVAQEIDEYEEILENLKEQAERKRNIKAD